MTGSSSNTAARSATGKRLLVIPSEPLLTYERVGVASLLQGYYNPAGMFSEVFAWCPAEPRDRRAHGMSVLTWRSLRRVLREVQPDVVRAYGGYWACDAACRWRAPGVPVVVSVHDPHPHMVHRSVRYAEMVVCMSEVVEQAVLARGTSPQRIRRLPNRIDRRVFRPLPAGRARKAMAGRFPPGRYVLHVGRKAREKNIETVVRALPLLPKEYRAVFVGRGNPLAYQRLAESIRAADRCHWVPRVANDELPLWYGWCDCMCTPSLWEGFGLVFIEAAACGAPVVTSDIPPMNRYLSHAESAHLVRDYTDPRALAGAIRRVCEDEAYRAKLGRGAVEACEPFDLPNVEAMETALYREALDMAAGTLTLPQRLDLRMSRLPHQLNSASLWARRNLRRLRNDLRPLNRVPFRQRHGTGASTAGKGDNGCT